MKKEPSIQKKKTPMVKFLDILFKVLVGFAVIIFAYIIYDKADFSSNKMEFSPKKQEYSNDSTPGKLRWYDDFKGVENVPDKNAKKEKESSGGSGFRYEGFKK